MSANAYLHIVCLEMKRDFMTLDTLVKWNHVKKKKKLKDLGVYLVVHHK